MICQAEYMLPYLVTVKAKLLEVCQQIGRGFGAHIIKPGLAHIICCLAGKITLDIVEHAQAYQELVGGSGLDFNYQRLSSQWYILRCHALFPGTRPDSFHTVRNVSYNAIVIGYTRFVKSNGEEFALVILHAQKVICAVARSVKLDYNGVIFKDYQEHKRIYSCRFPI